VVTFLDHACRPDRDERGVSTSLIYRSALGYELVMRGLYGRHYRDRLRAVADEVPEGSSVVELCCGPGTLYTRFLRGRVRSYTGLDVNERFVARLRQQGVDARVVDLGSSDEPPSRGDEPLARAEEALPRADVLLMQASLYHFLPHAEQILDRMLAAADQRVVVSEPIRNLSSSDNPVIGMLGRRSADPGVGGAEQRFTEETLDALMARYDVQLGRLIPGGREKLYVLRAPAARVLPAPAPPPPRRSDTAAGP
jgi:SAM-dependent methyltransferase